jgi:pimeloyl-ACP methyl ester carboxylesterase
VVGDLHGEEDPILTIHPIGVGLAGWFWDRFSRAWQARGLPRPLVHPDLLGCGRSSMPAQPLRPLDWAHPLEALIEGHLRRPVWLLVQGASLPIALELHALAPQRIRGMVLAGPPSWQVMTQQENPLLGNLLWKGFFRTPLGTLFYRYARSEGFLRSFSEQQLFARPQDVDAEWLAMLKQGSCPLDSRYAVFSFLAGFWRRDYTTLLEELQCPVLALFGDQASGISRRGNREPPSVKATAYGRRLPEATAFLLPGRNVLPYESTGPFTEAVAVWIREREAQNRQDE